MDFKVLLQTAEYDFIRSSERLGERIMLLDSQNLNNTKTTRQIR